MLLFSAVMPMLIIHHSVPAVIGRVIEDEGFRVAIVPQPNWKDDLRDFRKLGKPKYFLG